MLFTLIFVSGCKDTASTSTSSSTQEQKNPITPSSPARSPTTGVGSRQTGTTSNLSARTSTLTGAVSDFAAERTEFGTRVQLAADTLFEFDKAVLTPAAESNLGRTAELVRQGGPGTVTIIGHTDGKGTEGYNLNLSQRRAEVVAGWLHAQPQMQGRSFKAQGQGEADPVAPNLKPDGTDDPEGRARNRRVTVDIPHS